GAVSARVFTEYAEAVDPALGRWVRDNVRFPATMIDRIVPATTDADRAEVAGLLGLEDAWPVMAEPFLQWVIEDKFVGARPPFEQGGAEFVGDVAPYERMKLRMLNGTHSTMAYLGYLSGYEFIAQVIADADFRRFIGNALAEEIAPTLGMPKAQTDAYAAKLLERYSNTAMKHRTYQIAMDGSQKLPQRLLGTVTDRVKAGAPFERLALGIAAWMIYAHGKDLSGKTIPVQDPMAAEFARLSPHNLVEGYLAIERVFPRELSSSATFRDTVSRQLALLRQAGAAVRLRLVVRVLQAAREPLLADALDVRRVGRIFVGQYEALAFLAAQAHILREERTFAGRSFLGDAEEVEQSGHIASPFPTEVQRGGVKRRRRGTSMRTGLLAEEAISPNSESRRTGRVPERPVCPADQWNAHQPLTPTPAKPVLRLRRSRK